MNNEVDLQVSWKRIVPVVRGLSWDLLAHTLDRLFLSPAAGTPSHRHQQPINGGFVLASEATALERLLPASCAHVSPLRVVD